MAVADDALTEIFDVAVLLSHQGAPGGFHPRLVPVVDRPLRRLGAVVVLQRVALQTIARIARQISGGLFAWHVISPIRRLWMSLASGSNTSWSSISRRRRYSAWVSRQRCSPAPTRRSNSGAVCCSSQACRYRGGGGGERSRPMYAVLPVLRAQDLGFSARRLEKQSSRLLHES